MQIHCSKLSMCLIKNRHQSLVFAICKQLGPSFAFLLYPVCQDNNVCRHNCHRHLVGRRSDAECHRGRGNLIEVTNPKIIPIKFWCKAFIGGCDHLKFGFICHCAGMLGIWIAPIIFISVCYYCFVWGGCVV